jgi:hypothetical protein
VSARASFWLLGVPDVWRYLHGELDVDWERYKEIVSEYDAMLDYARKVSTALTGLTPSDLHHEYGEQIFVKILVQSITLRKLSPAPEPQSSNEIWDVSSVCMIARSVIEAHDALMYIAIDAVDAEEGEFRLLLWELHDLDRRRKMLEHIHSKNPSLAEIIVKGAKCREQIIKHAFFPSLNGNIRKRIMDGDAPPSHLSQRERCASSRIDFDYYNAVTMHLSQYVHTLPYSVHQLFIFKAGEEDALRLMALPLDYTLAFLARAIEGIRTIFPGATPDVSLSVKTSIVLRSELLERGVKNTS